MKFLAFAALGLLAAADSSKAHAQTALAPEIAAQALGRAHGLGELDGGLVAGGPGWSAEIDPEGVRVTAVLGREVDRSPALELGLAGVQRGSWARSHRGEILVPRLSGQRAVYERNGLSEWYESREGGLEQGFTFASEPAGEGDLLVELSVGGELARPDQSGWRDAVTFRHEGREVLSVSGVLGIDAAGQTQVGDLRYADGSLWLRLPAEFVDQAAYPLVLDPLIGSVGTVSSAGDAASPALAYHPVLNRFLAAWSVDLSSTQSELRAQLLDVFGAPVGGLITVNLGTSDTLARDPAVGFNRDAGSFLVAYRLASFVFGPYGISARSVSPGGSVSSATSVAASSAATGPELAIGSEAVAGQGDVSLLVYGSDNGADVKLARLQADVFGAPVVLGTTNPPDQSTFGNDQPTISHTGGNGGLYLVAWRSRGLLNDSVRCQVVRRDGVPLGSSQLLTLPDFNSIRRPSVDGFPASASNGRWLLAAQTPETVGATEHDVRAWSLSFDGTNLSVPAGPVFVDSGINDDEIEPAVVWMGSKAFVAWADEGGTFDYDIFVKGVDPSTCVECEPVAAAGTLTGFNRAPALAGELPSGGGNGDDRALILWERIALTLPLNSDIQSRGLVLAAQNGNAVSQGGGCTGGGSTGVNQVPAIGVGGFACTLSGADPVAPVAVLNIAVNGAALPIACGTCLIEPFFITTTVPMSGGSAAVQLPIPCRTTAIGAQLIVQWTVLLTSASPCFLAANVSFSDRLLVTIGS
jgi:hypothetical protein